MRFHFGTFQRAGVAALIAVILATTLAACGGGSKQDAGTGGSPSTSANTDATLTTAMASSIESQQPGSLLDPANFYGGEGLFITNSAYEGLVGYQTNPPTSKLEPMLAESWKVSADAKTYTFRLRPDVKFANGDPMTAEDVVWSFERFRDLEGGPSYMLAEVTDMRAANSQTVVLQLKAPSSPLLDYLASPYGPKVIDKSQVANSSDAKQGQRWLATHTAGTGPFQVSEYSPQEIVLERNQDYWNGKPKLAKVVVRIIEDASARTGAMLSGQLQMLRVDQPADFAQFEAQSDLQTITEPSLAHQFLAVNPTTAPFNDPEMRAALRAAIDRPTLVGQTWQELATVSEQMLPEGMMEPQDNPDPIEYDEGAALKAAVEKLAPEDRKVVIAYNSFISQDQRVAEVLASVLEEDGLEPKLFQPSPGQVWWEPTAPQLFVSTSNPDSANPDSWMQIFFNTSGDLNYLNGGTKEADVLMSKGAASVSAEEAKRYYSEAAKSVEDSNTFISIADPKNSNVAVSGFSGWGANVAAPFSLVVNTASLSE